MKLLLYPLLVLLALNQMSAEAERLIDRPLSVQAFHERKENMIGASVAIAAYYFPHLEGSWIGSEIEKPHAMTIRIKGYREASCFTKEGEKVFELELSKKGFPCFAYGTVKREEQGYFIELDSVYEASPDNLDWIKTVRGEPITDRPRH